MTGISVWVRGVSLAVGIWTAVFAGAGLASAAPDSNPGAAGSDTRTSSVSARPSGATSDPANPATATSPDQATSRHSPRSNDSYEPETSTNGSKHVGNIPEKHSSTTTGKATADIPAGSEGGGTESTVKEDRGTAAAGTATPQTEDPAGTLTINVGRHDTASSATRPVAPQHVRSQTPSAPAVQDDITRARAVQTADATPGETAEAVIESRQIATTVAWPAARPKIESTESTRAVLAIATAADSPSDAAAYGPHQPSVLDLIGTLFFNIFNLGFRLLQGPPQLPPGSTVTVHSSTLQLAPGHEVPADWYVPENPDPDRLIYFQHGFVANAATYSYTIAALAEQTNSIVVAPSITSNFFATDGFWLAGTPTHQAVANLFSGSRDALTASETAALGYQVTPPQHVVLVGHSLGANLVLGAAADMVANGTIADLAGVVLLDGYTTDIVGYPAAASALAVLPADVPVYNIASPPYYWSAYGTTSAALVNARPGQFNGVQLAGGVHVDAMQGGNPLIQLIGYLGTGFSRPENIEAVKILASGWINDMFAGTHDGIYAAPGATIQIPSDVGTATATVLWEQNPSLGWLDQLVVALETFVGARFFNFEPTEGPLVLF